MAHYQLTTATNGKCLQRLVELVYDANGNEQINVLGTWEYCDHRTGFNISDPNNSYDVVSTSRSNLDVRESYPSAGSSIRIPYKNEIVTPEVIPTPKLLSNEGPEIVRELSAGDVNETLTEEITEIVYAVDNRYQDTPDPKPASDCECNSTEKTALCDCTKRKIAIGIISALVILSALAAVKFGRGKLIG